MIGNKFGECFKKARSQRGYTQKTFCEAFNADENITTIDSVRNWEQGKCVPEINTILKLCDFFECDIDYLFGRISCTTHDTQFICDKTGLSEQAILMLENFRYDENISSFINGIIAHRDGCTIESLATISAIIKDECPKISEGQVAGLESHQLLNSIYGYLFECQEYLMRYIKDKYIVRPEDSKNAEK